MHARATLLASALEVLEHRGEAGFSTRAVCAMAGVTAPTLYHHFGSADGLLSAAITEAFAQFRAWLLEQAAPGAVPPAALSGP